MIAKTLGKTQPGNARRVSLKAAGPPREIEAGERFGWGQAGDHNKIENVTAAQLAQPEKEQRSLSTRVCFSYRGGKQKQMQVENAREKEKK